jgi:putative hemolysin
MEHFFRFGLLFLLLGLSAFFSASEVAFFSLSRAQVDSLREGGGRAGLRAAQLLERPGRLLVTIYIWNELINVSIAAVSTVLALQLFGPKAAAAAVALSAFLIIVLGDISPKSFALKYARDYAMFSALPMGLFCAAVSPAQALITWMVAKFVARVSPPGSGPSSAITEDEFRTILHRGEDKGVIESEEKEMIINVFELGDTRATEIMTPRTEIFAL